MLEVPLLFAAPGELGSAAAKIPSAAENILHISEQALEHLAENYPHLAMLADKLGYGGGVSEHINC